MHRTLTVVLITMAMAIGMAAAAGAVTLNGAGATFPQPLYEKWFHDFQQKTKHQVNYQGIGSGGGIKAISAGTVNFAGSDAPLTDAELKGLPRPIVQIPTVGGAVALACNISGVSGLRLSPRTLAGIYLGYITKWNDARLKVENPGKTLPSRPITVVHRSDASGTTFIFTTYLTAVSPDWKSKVGADKSVKWPCGEGGKGNPGVAGLVKQIPGSIGYVELAYATQNRLATVSLRNQAGKYVAPSLQSSTACIAGALSKLKKDVRSPVVNGAGAGTYPIVGLTFILIEKTQKDASVNGALRQLMDYALGEGQKSAPSLQYVPLPAELIAICKAKMDAVKAQ